MNDTNLFPPTYGGRGPNLSDVPLASLPGAIPRVPQFYDSPEPITSVPDRPPAAMSEILAAHFVRKSYRKGPLTIPVLQGVELAVHQSEFVSIVGPSGCGKTTLLHLLATLDRPDAGEICFEGNRIDNLPSAGRDILRNRYFGMVFQF